MMVPEHFHARRLKVRSQSMPSINPIIMPQPIHRASQFKKKHSKKQQYDKQLPVISLYGIHNQQEQELKSKIKAIAERSLKKLEERYDTVDRWKQRHLHDCSHVQPKAKFNQHGLIPLTQEKREDQDSCVAQKDERMFPIIAKQPINPQIPDQRQQSRKLEAQIMARLQKNKRYYYEVKDSESFKDINYFQSSRELSIDKWRQKQLKNMSGSDSKTNKLLGIVHRKLSEPKMDYMRNKGHNFNLFNEDLNMAKLKMKKPRSIHDFKQQLLKQAVEQVPEGWNFEEEANPPGEENEENDNQY